MGTVRGVRSAHIFEIYDNNKLSSSLRKKRNSKSSCKLAQRLTPGFTLKNLVGSGDYLIFPHLSDFIQDMECVNVAELFQIAVKFRQKYLYVPTEPESSKGLGMCE